VTDLKLGARDIDYDDRAQVAAICKEFTTLYARTDETHDAAIFDAIPEARRKGRRGIEVGQIFYFGTKYSEPMGAVVVTTRAKRAGRNGQPRHRRQPPAGRDHRGQP
jgi:prolyl-tRNA synthetase